MGDGCGKLENIRHSSNLRKSKLGLFDVKVVLGIRIQLDKLVQVSTEGLELQVSNLQNVCATVTQESRVMRHHDAGEVLERIDIVLDIDNIPFELAKHTRHTNDW
jgi:hypothetical protein